MDLRAPKEWPDTHINQDGFENLKNPLDRIMDNKILKNSSLNNGSM